MDLGKMTDEQLIELLREGKTEITDYLMEKYKDMVRKQARAMYLWGGENDDLIQEGMIGLFKAVQDYDPKEGASFSSFAGLCVSRQMYTAIKASQRKKHLPLNSYVSIYASASDNPEENGLSIVDTIEAGKESNPELMILGEEYTNAFEEELKEKLSKLERKVLYLHLQGMEYLKIAEFMDKSPKTIDNALQRIKAKARQLLELVPEDLRKPELTAEWEMKLSKIAEGKLSDRKFMNEIRTYSTDLVKEIKTAEGTFRHDNMTNKLCPNCGKRLLAVNGKNSRMLVCQDRECGYRQTIAKTTNARCPQCHKRMELIGSGENASFVCKCGYKERLSKFQERRKKEGAGVSKRDVQNYLKKQQKEAKQETGSNAMLDALKNIKL